MDHGWFTALASGEIAPAQVGLVREGRSGAPVPDLSVDVDVHVDDVDGACARAVRRGVPRSVPIAYALRDEPWGVRRFFIRDPAGTLLNVLAHLA